MANEPKPQLPTQPHVPAAATGTKPRTGMILTIAALVFLAAAVGAFFVWKKKSNNQPDQTAEDIRNAFAPPATTTQPSFTPPAPGGQYGFSGATSTPPQTATDTAGNNSGPLASGGGVQQPSAPVQPAGVTTYQNGSLGFQMTIPAAWLVQPSGNNTVYFFDQTSGLQQGYVEAYPNNGQTLDDLAEIFAKSSSVTCVDRTTVSGLPAIKFCARDASQSGLALISNNTIYYLRGGLGGQTGTFQPLANGTSGRQTY